MFCPSCGTWNRMHAVECGRCAVALPDLPTAPFEKPDEEITLLRRATGARYRVVRRLGGGGMASVFLGEHGCGVHPDRPLLYYRGGYAQLER